ncbi:hypothetical protein DFS13_1861 [Burkholderia sp. 28_3]|uniref:Uncharacterized protein n=2 Tax=Burkholderiales TaxID=80840 RepID=B2T0S5_PARPJ|nr:conserved hypothetical protein [Paraburkholderia phytofirmans PsJN]PRZ55805.1 hypothetical protein BX589_103394 [Paraburkholderia fungorum]PZW88445.1 hypothetical protein DFS13_1861 [Burkholderia sp. 28_3]RAS39392.1 hypothetical protein DFS07_1512 [Burkholderia cenocepacia]
MMDMPVRKHPMPEIAAFVAELRRAFGDATIDEAVARGKAGEPTFFASENGLTVGTRSDATVRSWRVDGSVLNRHFCRGCAGSCIGTDIRCSQRR